MFFCINQPTERNDRSIAREYTIFFGHGTKHAHIFSLQGGF